MIFEKLFNLQKDFETLQKKENNHFFKSKYLALDEILKHYIPLLNKNKIICYHYTKDDLVITKLADYEDFTFIESEFKIFNSDPQKRGSEITYGRRYNIIQLLNINAEDDDGNKASGNNFIESKELPWIGEENIKNLEKLFNEGKKIPLQDVRKKYKVSKLNTEKLKIIGII